MKFKTLVELANKYKHDVGYKEEAKREFIRLGRKLTKDLVAELESAGIVNVEKDYNEGGIAVSGEFTVRGLYESGRGGFYLQISIYGFSSSFGFYRATKGLKDYTGGKNRTIDESLLDPQTLAKLLLSESMRDEADHLSV
jgi:hypothetical protein